MGKKSIFIAMLLLGTLFVSVTSCKKKKVDIQQAEKIASVAPVDSFSGKDTAEVKYLVDMFIDRLNHRDISGAVKMLSFLDGDKIVSLPPGLVKRQTMTLQSFKAKRYEIEKLVFVSEKESVMKVNCILFDRKPGDTRPNQISMIIKPVRRDGRWYLTMADTMTDTNGLHGTQIPN